LNKTNTHTVAQFKPLRLLVTVTMITLKPPVVIFIQLTASFLNLLLQQCNNRNFVQHYNPEQTRGSAIAQGPCDAPS